MRSRILLIATCAGAMVAATGVSAAPTAASGVATDRVVVFPGGQRTDELVLDAALVLHQRPWVGTLSGRTSPATMSPPGRINAFDVTGTSTVPGRDLSGTCQGTVTDRSTAQAMADVVTLTCFLSLADGTPGQSVTFRLALAGSGAESTFNHVTVTDYQLAGAIAG